MNIVRKNMQKMSASPYLFLLMHGKGVRVFFLGPQLFSRGWVRFWVYSPFQISILLDSFKMKYFDGCLLTERCTKAIVECISIFWPVYFLQLQLGWTRVWASATQGLHGGPCGLEVCPECQHHQHSSDPGHFTEEQSTWAGQSQWWGHYFKIHESF